MVHVVMRKIKSEQKQGVDDLKNWKYPLHAPQPLPEPFVKQQNGC